MNKKNNNKIEKSFEPYEESFLIMMIIMGIIFVFSLFYFTRGI